MISPMLDKEHTMKKISILLVIALISLMCLSACGTANTDTVKDTDASETAPVTTEKVSESGQPNAKPDTAYDIETVGEKDMNDNGEVIGDCHYQKVVFTNPDAALKEINKEIAEDCNEFFDEGLGNQYEEYFSQLPDAAKADLVSYPYVATYDVDSVFIDDNYVSVYLVWEWYAGGVHNYGSKGLNFDLKTGEEIDFEDLFASEAEARTAFSDALNKLIDSDPESFFEEAKDTVKNYDLDEVNFIISKNGITVFINQYEIAPGASGSFTVDIAR